MNCQTVTDFCKKYYDEETYEHARRVAHYALNSPVIQHHLFYLNFSSVRFNSSVLYSFAFAHDLIETGRAVEDVKELFKDVVDEVTVKNYFDAITRRQDETYIEYIHRLKESDSFYAYLVKLADIKDHLTQKATLTESLKERYIRALEVLL